jgi:DNA polymerase-1
VSNAPIGFDLETANANEMWTYGDKFVKLAGFTGEEGKPEFTTDAHELIKKLEDAPWIYGHNIFGFDLLALARWYGADWEALTAKALDTMILDRLDYPPQARDTGGSVDKYDLDHVAERRGVQGKTGDLKEIIKKHGGYDQVPADDPEYREYLAGDVNAIANLINKLPRSAYAKREHKLAALAGRMTLNGFRVDIPLLEKRIAKGASHKRDALEILRDDYNLPLGRIEWTGRGKDKEEKWVDFDSPLSTLEGRQWLAAMYDAYGIKNPPVTDKGRLATSADVLQPLADSDANHPDLRRIIYLMQVVTTTRTVYQTVQDHLAGDRVHASVSMGQASGRWSVTRPGLTVFGKRGERWHEREVFIPEEGHVILSCDMSQLDMRAVAGLSQDHAYIENLAPGKDFHAEIAAQVFGTPERRQAAKAIGHGYNYGLGANKMIANGFDPELVATFFAMMTKKYPRLEAWKKEVRDIGSSGRLLDNSFGRKMKCEPQRAYTQAPALMGQGAATDIMKEGLLHLPSEFHPFLRLMVHDEIVMSVPISDVEEIGHEVRKAMTFEWRGVPILCDLSKPGASWGEVSAK